MHLKPLTKNQIACGKALLSCIAQGRYTIEYNQLEAMTGVYIRRIGTEIGELSRHCHALGLPLISAMVVGKNTQLPDFDGFTPLCYEYHVHPELHGKIGKLIEACMADVRNCTEWHKFADYLGVTIEGLTPAPVSEDTQPEGSEGAMVQVNATAYERNPAFRAECLRIHGTSCKICGFDAGAVYGEAFAGKIHVHHITPLGEIKESHAINPATDLIPVCPNCHMILHSKKDGVYLPDEVAAMLKKS